jgi:arsenic resistance protein ArsH
MNGHGDLNNSHAARQVVELPVDPGYRYRSLAIEANDDDAAIRQLYRPFIMHESFAADDWVEHLELSTVLKLVESEILVKNQPRLRILVLYGSLRNR